jgi:hypothetical protein
MFQHDTPQTARAMRGATPALHAAEGLETGAEACPRQALLVLACVHGLNRDGLGCDHDIFFLLLGCACRNGCDKAECGQHCDALGHLSLLSLFKGPGTASCQSDPDVKVRNTSVFPAATLSQFIGVAYGMLSNAARCDAKAAVRRAGAAALARCCGCIKGPPRYRCRCSGEMPRKTVWHRGRTPRIP